MKKIALGFATCGLILSSCSSNDVFEDNQGTNNPNVINFSATTTRASVNNLESLQKDQNGFPVYAVTADNKQQNGKDYGWYIENKKYTFTSDKWGWDASAGNPQWPAVSRFPMNFYAYYPADADGFTPNPTVPTGTDAAALTGTFTINATAETQIDFLAANASGISRPAATIPLAFKHITTKINFGVITAQGTKSYVQQMNINNVKNTGTYDYTEKAPATPDVILKNWTLTGFTMNGSNQPVKPAYDYYGTTVVSDPIAIKDTKDFTCAPGVEEGAVSFYDLTSDTDKNKNLMLLPQKETTVWDKTVTAVTNSAYIPGDAYIGSVYRMSSADDLTDLVGYADASKHPDMKNLAVGNTWKNYTGGLFVKVGFPLNNDFTWIMGKAYTYNIMLGQNNSTGGYLLDDHYYDDYGRRTDLTIDGKKPGDPVSGGTINFDVKVGNWEDGENQPGPIQ